MKSYSNPDQPNFPSARQTEVIFLKKREFRQYLENHPGQITGPVSTRYVRANGYSKSQAEADAADQLRQEAGKHRANIVVTKSKKGAAGNFATRLHNFWAQMPFNYRSMAEKYGYDYVAELYRIE